MFSYLPWKEWKSLILVSYHIVLNFFQVFINNEWHKSVSGKTFKTVNPATGEAFAEIQEGSKVCFTKPGLNYSSLILYFQTVF